MVLNIFISNIYDFEFHYRCPIGLLRIVVSGVSLFWLNLKVWEVLS